MRLAILLCSLAPLAGCGAHTHRLGGTEIEQRSSPTPSRSRASLAPELRLAVGPLTLAGGPAADPAEPGEPEERGSTMPVDVPVVRRALRDLLRESGAFDEVFLTEERHGKATFVLETHLARAAVRRVEPEDGSFRKIANWIFLGWFAMWQHDRSYALEVEPVFTLRDLRTGFTCLDKVRVSPGRGQDSLSLHERRGGVGPVVATMLCVPYFLFDARPSEVAHALAHASLQSPVEDLLARVAKMTTGWQVETSSTGKDRDVSARLEGTTVDDLHPIPDAKLTIVVESRGDAGRLKAVRIGGRESRARANGTRVVVSLMSFDLTRPIDVKAILEDGSERDVMQIRVRQVTVERGSGQ